MKYLLTIILATGLLASQSLASGCSEMAAFNTQVNNFLETANLTSDTKDKIKNSLIQKNYIIYSFFGDISDISLFAKKYLCTHFYENNKIKKI